MRCLFALIALCLGAASAFAQVNFPIAPPSTISVVTGGNCTLNETVIGTPNATATTVNTSTGAISAPNQFVAGQQIVFGATGLNAAYSAATIYYVIAGGLTSSAFEVSATNGGSAIVPVTSTMTATAYPTWTPSATTNFVWITEVGGGGGGGGGNTTSGGGGGGGGPGWTIVDYGTPVTASTFLTLNIGLAGTFGAIAGNGGAGGYTGVSGAVFNVPVAIAGSGGGHGAASLGGAGAANVTNGAFANGATGGGAGSASAGGVGSFNTIGTTFSWLISGTGGGGGGSTGGFAGGASRAVFGTSNVAGGTSTSLGGGGAGGSSVLGAGGAGGSDGGTGTAPASSNYGAGGGGGATNTAGGAGMNGAVIIRWCS